MDNEQTQSQTTTTYRLFWPSTKRGETFLNWLLVVIGLGSFIRGCVVYDLRWEDLPDSGSGEDLLKVLFFNVGLNLLC